MINPTSQQVDEILEKLSTDDAFRAQFSSDPAGTLKAMGIAIDPAMVSNKPALATKEEIAKVRDSVRASGDGEDGFIIFYLKG